MDADATERSLGDYRLRELLAESSVTRRWLAEQVSVGRKVLLDELKPEQEAYREEFLADVRAKAAVDHPLVGSVYEALAQPEVCFFAHELLPGSTLEDRRLANASLPPARLAHVIRRVAEAQIQQESAGIAASPLGLEHIHLDEHGVIRLENLAVGGARSADHTRRDIARLGERLRNLVADGRSGSTRALTLLGWMRGENIQSLLSWEQVRDIAIQIEQQLAEPVAAAATTKAAMRSGSKPPIALIAGTTALVAVFGLLFWLKSGSPPVSAPATDPLPGAVLIPEGAHPTPDGTEEPLAAFRISAHEVTIGEYAAFIETLATLAKDQRERTFDHENQPAGKTSHLPDDWENLLSAARSNGTWNGRPVSTGTPVVGVDWWDCAAYAEWKQARLPTQEEWFAALRKDVAAPNALVPSPWQPVTAASTDRTPPGVLGLAGSVAEWTRRPATNPANPLGERKWLIIGGSYLKPGTNALTREWVDDRSLRRPDVGFRLVFDAK
jgi:formylglycine-generating enzyme required for sulfatase activity